MTSKPQLRADINQLQDENRALKARVAELENMPKSATRIIEVQGPIRYVDNPKLVDQIKKMRALLNGRD